ncbi:MAG: hypothetical protein KAW14_03530 [Candidatus Aegiribacteria sp.]|nr:hypothetical protein [Candidatus Aegiribacteria sp.]
MTDDRQLVEALKKAAEQVLKRSLSESETSELIRFFNEAKGTTANRAKKAITKIARISDSELMEKIASSDDTDRIMHDLEAVASEWKPSE